MADILGAKDVAREELNSSRSQSPADEEAQKFFLERFKSDYSYEPATQTIDQVAAKDAAEKDEEDGLQFRLFAPSKKTASTTINRIQLDEATKDNAEPGLLRHKPRSYYFKDDLSSEVEAELRKVAITGQQVLQASSPYPFLRRAPHMQWKLKDVKTLTTMYNALVKKKVRPGKKSRIATRRKAQKTIELAEKKDLEDRMKKSKKNRDKKLRQREKEKAKKAAAKAEAGEAAGEHDDYDESDDD